MPERAQSSIASIFIGSNGLRAGWRFLLFALAIEVGVFVLEEPLGQILGRLFAINPRELSAPALLIDEFVFCLSVFLITGIFALAERRRIDSYGLPIAQAFGKFFWKGMLAALLVVLFMAGAMILSGAMVLHGLALHGSDLARLALLWFVANILLGLAEEYTFRGYALQSLWRGAGFWPAAVITTAIFAGDHLEKPGENAMDIGMIFFLGLVICLSVRKTGSLWWAVGWHAGFDFGQLFLIGTRNGGQTPVGRLFNVTFPGPAWLNGGELGTEASIFMVPAAIATFVYVMWFLRGRSLGQFCGQSVGIQKAE
jgi:membrane protease YdiL (CAAX protease family)